MFDNHKISIALATYNGEKYIRQQIESMCKQTVMPDEIIISDDGSSDNTLGIANDIAREWSDKLEIVILQNNPRKGYCGNFEWAIKHTTGDFIFVSDQDDVWKENKIEEVMRVFSRHPEAECVIHEAELIDKDGKYISGVFNEWTKSNLLNKGIQSDFQLTRELYLEDSVSGPLANGMVLCVSRTSLNTSIPFPKCDGSHDAWIIFAAIVNDKCWYTPSILTEYRIHDTNTCATDGNNSNMVKRVKRIQRRINVKGIRNALNNLYIGQRMKEVMEEKKLTDSSAYLVSERLIDIGKSESKAVQSCRISGAFQLWCLYRKDTRYRNSGKNQFISQLLRILIFGKKKRNKILFQ